MDEIMVRVLSGDDTYGEKTTEDSEVVALLLNGASLSAFVVPDSSIPSNYPEHTETYKLPHIIINGSRFWAKSETAHLGFTIGSPEWSLFAYCYTNIGPVFCTYRPDNHVIRVMSRFRCKTHCWIIKKDYSLIWDSETDTSAKPIKKAIESCSKFRIAMLDSEDVWNIHPVDLPMYYPENENFALKTAMDEYPLFFRYPDETVKLLSAHQTFFSKRPDDNLSLVSEAQGFPSFYSLGSDGIYYNLFDIPRATKNKYKRLKVFVDR